MSDSSPKQNRRNGQARAFSVPIESARKLYFFYLTRCPSANRYPLRGKTL
jgi:hypothetical protein